MQFQVFYETADSNAGAVIEYLSPRGKAEDERYFGKGATSGQALASACIEFIERQCAKMKPDDFLLEAALDEVAPDACDPHLFCLAPEAGYDTRKEIDWVWGYSLSRAEPVLVPANLVFCPYKTDREEKYIAWTDSNGLASGNNIEEAILHGILEVIERDALIINEYNKLRLTEMIPDGLPSGVRQLLEQLTERGFYYSFKVSMTDIPITVVTTYLQHMEDNSTCSVAFGCHIDSGLAIMRSITEAIQLLPPSVNHEEWRLSGSPQRYSAETPDKISLCDLTDHTSSDLRKNIETCVSILSKFESEVVVVDLSLPEFPFNTVRVLATGLQPLIHEGDMRLSRRFFDVPVILGHSDRPVAIESVRIWPVVGYR